MVSMSFVTVTFPELSVAVGGTQVTFLVAAQHVSSAGISLVGQLVNIGLSKSSRTKNETNNNNDCIFIFC